MADRETNESKPLLSRKTTRRAVLGGTIAAGTVAAAYAALGDRLDLFGGNDAATSARIVDVAKDAEAIKDEKVKINHLLRRAGFGVTREEYDHYQSIGLSGTIDELVNYSQVDDSAAIEAANAVPLEGQGNRFNLSAWWLVRITTTKRPLQEKITLFWHGLLTSQISVVKDEKAMQAQNEFLRSHAMDSFPTILKGISQDKAMMVYLDISGSTRVAPNENYARELMELFSLGEGNYTEADVREASKAFTGWNVPRNRVSQNEFYLGEPLLRPGAFDSSIKRFLGQSGNFRPDDIVDIIVRQPASASYIVGRLFSWFIYPNPSESDLRPFIDVYLKNEQRIGAVVEAMLRSDVFYSPKAYRSIIKSPVEYFAGATKALGLQNSIAQLSAQVRGPLQSMGQVLFEPPNVAGWPGGSVWLNSATMFARLNFINALTNGGQYQGENRGQRPDASGRGPVRGPSSAPFSDKDLGTARAALDHFLPVVLDDNVPDEARRLYADYGGGLDTTLSSDRLRGLVYLILASPQFHLS